MDSNDFKRHFKAAAEYLAEHKDDINKLNVFPVPDGDTGTNMSLTIGNVVKELDELPANASLSDMRKAVIHGSLMGARGNSGVITSQILRGFCEGLEGAVSTDTATLATALGQAVEIAFAAVRRPVEGTILTVIKDMAEVAARAAESDLSVEAAMRALVDEAFASVRRTPELLPVLKENGVVDAGGYGLALLCQGFVDSFTGITSARYQLDDMQAGLYQPQVAIEQINDWSDSEYLYCTEFLLQSEALDIEATRSWLASAGGSELLVGDHPNFKIHVHTDTPGDVLNYITAFGQVYDVHIHNMRLQTAERSALLEQQAVIVEVTSAPKERGYIAVASGLGMQRILESLGVDIIVNGGQTMNPSTAELLTAIEEVNAPEVVLFPNNKNIIMAAQAAAEVSSKKVAVIPTKSVPECFSALFVANASQDLEDEAESMIEAAAAVHAAEITHAVKDAVSDNGQAIQAGDVIGITEDSIEIVGSDVSQVAVEMVARIADDSCDTLTLLAGEQLGQDDFEALVALIEDSFPDLEVDARRGDQPLYPLVMAAE